MLHRKIAVMDRFNTFWGYLSLWILCGQLTLTSTRTSTLWKLNPDEGKITSLKDEGEDAFMLTPTASEKFKDDEVFSIITSTVVAYGSYGHSWSKQSVEKNCDPSCVDDLKDLQGTSAPQGKLAKKSNHNSDEILDCGKPVNFTFYDYLIGVSQRFNHPPVPEPEVAYLFLKNKDEQAFKKFDVNALERRLKRAKKEKPKSVHLYNQIGNYWRIKGDARQSIECFRRALAISPTNSEVLLNLARVLFNLQYLDDAIHLTRRSLEVQPPDRSAWRQYFTLGEIFKAYGHFQESLLHLRHALELYPQHEPILRVLRDVENAPASPLHVYTIFIIFALIIAVFIVVVTSSDGSDSNSSQSEFEPKIQRHFNRAMAMRSLKGFSSRTFKHRRY